MRAIERGVSGVARTQKLGNGVTADFDEAGTLIGVELLGTKAVEHLFSLVSTNAQLSALVELEPKRRWLERLIA
jgi:hypothetical protein